MKTRLDTLMKKASTAQPPAVQARSSWLPYVPVVRVLMEQRAHSLQAAVEWLVRQGEVPQDRQGGAYRALRQILARRDAKRLRQQARALHVPADAAAGDSQAAVTRDQSSVISQRSTTEH